MRRTGKGGTGRKGYEGKKAKKLREAGQVKERTVIGRAENTKG